MSAFGEGLSGTVIYPTGLETKSLKSRIGNGSSNAAKTQSSSIQSSANQDRQGAINVNIELHLY